MLFFIILRNSVDGVCFNVLLLSFVGLVLEVLLGHIVNFVSESIPEVLETEIHSFVDDHRWSVNGSNLSSFPKEWLNPLVVDSATLIGLSLDKNLLGESSCYNNTIFDNGLSTVAGLKNWSSQIHGSSSERCGLLLLDLFNREWFIC